VKTTIPNTTEQTPDAVKRNREADPSSEAEIAKRLSMRPATKRRIETMSS
jgi:ribosome-binding protein aMBF1 (putative translation factor)